MNSFGSIPVKPLANPKGAKLNCELCGKPAHLQCKGCRVTYYCDKEHQLVDFKGIHQKICQLLIPLRTPISVLGSEEERKHRESQTRARKTQLIEIAKTEAHKLLFEGEYDLAIPAALQALRFSMELAGGSSIELVPSYLLLGEASIGLKQYEQAETYLSHAKWAILKADHCENAVRSQLHRNFGLLYASQGSYDKALYQLAMDIYYISEAKTPEDIVATGGYFQLGNVFNKQGRIEEANAMFDRIVAIWEKTLKVPELHLDDAQSAEAVQILTCIHAFRLSHSSSLVAATEVLYTLSKVYHVTLQNEKAMEYARKAFNEFASSLGKEHVMTMEASNFVQELESF